MNDAVKAVNVSVVVAKLEEIRDDIDKYRATALKQLEAAVLEDDPESTIALADGALCDLLLSLGLDNVVHLYRIVKNNE